MKKGVKSKKQSDLITDVGSLIKFLSKLKPETKIKSHASIDPGNGDDVMVMM